MLVKAINGLAARMRCEIVDSSRAKGKTGAAVNYVGLVFRGRMQHKPLKDMETEFFGKRLGLGLRQVTHRPSSKCCYPCREANTKNGIVHIFPSTAFNLAHLVNGIFETIVGERVRRLFL